VTTVAFGYQAGTNVTVDPNSNGTRLTVNTPLAASGQVTVTASNASLTSPASAPQTTYQFVAPGSFVPLLTRICATEAGSGTECSGSTTDNLLAPGQSRDVQVTGVGGIPASGVAAVAMDFFTGTPDAGSYGNAGVYPTGLAGGASGLSWVNGNYGTILVEIPVGANGQVTVSNSPTSSGRVNFILDVQGYVLENTGGPAGLVNPIAPIQPPICNTATNSGTQCAVANNVGWNGGNTYSFQVLGQGGVPSSGVSAVVLNVQTYGAPQAGWLVAYPGGAARPSTASMLWNGGMPLTTHIIVPVDSTGRINVYNGQPAGTGTQASIGVDAWFTDSSNTSATGGLYDANNGTLICDTLPGTGTPCTGTQLTAGNIMPVKVAGLGGVPSMSPALIGVELSLTVTNVDLTGYPAGTGTFVCMYTSGGSFCPEAQINTYGGVPANLQVILPLGTDGKVDVYTPTGKMDVLIAVTGYYEEDPNPPTACGYTNQVYGSADTYRVSGDGDFHCNGELVSVRVSEELLDANNNIVAEGPGCSLKNAIGCHDSFSTIPPAPGQYTAQMTSQATSSGANWGPPTTANCTGWGSKFLFCTDKLVFYYAPGVGTIPHGPNADIADLTLSSPALP